MSWFLGYFQSWDISTASVRTTVCHCGVVSSRLLSQCKIREELLKCPGRACPCLFCAQLSCGEGEALGLLVLGCSMWRCSLSRARALHRDHRGCFWICWAETTLTFVLLAAERFGQRISCEHKHSQGSGFRQISLFQRRNRHTLPPHGLLDVWKAFGEGCGLWWVCYFIPCCGVWAEAGGSCFPVLQARHWPSAFLSIQSRELFDLDSEFQRYQLLPLACHFWPFSQQNLQTQAAVFLAKKHQRERECFHYLWMCDCGLWKSNPYLEKHEILSLPLPDSLP